jgi:chaperonin cofactor prefoldin
MRLTTRYQRAMDKTDVDVRISSVNDVLDPVEQLAEDDYMV